jgi:RNA-directed DNA polymerase
MSLKLIDDDPALAARFTALRTLHDVASLLEVKPGTLGYYINRPNNYKTFQIHKRSGGLRAISTPITPLKILQRKLNQVLHAVYRGRGPVHGFVRGRGIVSNAKQHLGKLLVLNFDLEDFFPSIHFGRVLGLFEGKPYGLPHEAAVTLAKICCTQGALPIGAPTSPIVANMICAQMDSQLKMLCRECGSRYTRYADDLSISTHFSRFHPAIAQKDPDTKKWELGEHVTDIVASNYFKINPAKTRFLPSGYRQEVTGLIVGAKVNVKRKVVRQVRAMLHAAERWGVKAAADEFHSRYDRKQRLKKKPDFLRVLRGKIEFVGSVRGRDDVIYLRLADRFLRLNPRAKFRPVVVGPAATLEVLERAVWILEERGGGKQGTAFAAEGLDLLTAAHVLGAQNEATCAPLAARGILVAPARRDDHVDVARLTIPGRIPVQLPIGDSSTVRAGEVLRVLGFPLHRDGGSVHVNRGLVTAFSPWHGVPHWIVDCPIVHGNSGGPVLNAKNEVVGIAVKGQGIPRVFQSDDELSRFVPIEFALRYLR